MQWDDRGGPGLRQRQQAVRQRDQGPVAAVQEGGDDLGEFMVWACHRRSHHDLATSSVVGYEA